MKLSDETFPLEYEDFIKNSLRDLPMNMKMEKLLKEKRDFGLKKYGAISFQSTLENAMKVDTIEHAKDELVDYMNYTLHEIFKNSRLGEYQRVFEARERFKKAFALFNETTY